MNTVFFVIFSIKSFNFLFNIFINNYFNLLIRQIKKKTWTENALLNQLYLMQFGILMKKTLNFQFSKSIEKSRLRHKVWLIISFSFCKTFLKMKQIDFKVPFISKRDFFIFNWLSRFLIQPIFFHFPKIYSQ